MKQEEEPTDLEAVDREIRIERLKQELNELSDGNMIIGGCEDCPPAVLEQFLERVKAYEMAEVDTDFNRLRRKGIELPHPDELDPVHTTLKLWEIIRGLARMQVFITNTNHLSDQELYRTLWTSCLREPTNNIPPGLGGATHLDVLGSGSEQDMLLYLKYFADEEYREGWRREFPDDEIPPHQDPPCDRDRHLPKAPW